MKTPPRSRRSRPAVVPGLTLLGAGTLLALAGCFDNDPGLQERLVRTQAELQDRSRRVQELESALEKARATPTPAVTEPSPATAAATPAMLTKEQLEETYVAAAKDMRQKVESELSGYAVENCTLFKVDMPSVALPYTSKVALNLRSSAGQPYRLEFPVGADWSGKWTFPATGDVVATLEKVQTQAAASPRPPAGGGSGGGGPRGPAASGGGSSAPVRPVGRYGEGPANTAVETIEMSWGNSRRSPGVAAPRQPVPDAPTAGGGGSQTPRVSSAPQPSPPPGNAAGGPPRPAMQAERDVLIQF